MYAITVIKSHDVCGDICFSFRLIGLFALPNTLYFEVQEEAFCHCIVPTVALTAHAADEAMLCLHSLVLAAGILTATVGVNDQPRLWLTLLYRHVQCGADQFSRHARRHRPPKQYWVRPD